MQANFHLDRLLVILVGPHIVVESARQCIESDCLDTIADRSVAQDGKRLLQRKQRLDHRAEFASLRWIAASEMFIAGEHTVRQAMISIQSGEHLLETTTIELGV